MWSTLFLNTWPNCVLTLQGQMNDASEVLGVIFNCLHRSFTPACDVSDTEPVDGKCIAPCIAHLIFGMDILERMNCYNCGLESRCLKYTSFFHNINASALRTMKVCCLIEVSMLMLHQSNGCWIGNLGNYFFIKWLIIYWLPCISFQVMYPDNSFDELLNLVEMNYQLACDPEDGGCGKLNYIHHLLSSPPHVFTTGDALLINTTFSIIPFV